MQSFICAADLPITDSTAQSLREKLLALEAGDLRVGGFGACARPASNYIPPSADTLRFEDETDFEAVLLTAVSMTPSFQKGKNH